MDAAFAEYGGDHKLGNIVVIVGSSPVRVTE